MTLPDRTTSSALRPQTDIVTRARGAIGTPFRHQGRQPHVGLDCLGLVVHAIGRGAEAVDQTDYARVPDSIRLAAALHRYFDHLDIEDPADAPAGAVLAFCVFGDPRRSVRHLGIKSDRGMIHARHGARNAVVEIEIRPAWRDLFVGAYQWRAQ